MMPVLHVARTDLCLATVPATTAEPTTTMAATTCSATLGTDTDCARCGDACEMQEICSNGQCTSEYNTLFVRVTTLHGSPL